MGRPNVGKSTLLNALLGQKVAAVSPRPQTTRRRQLGILSLDTAQIIFVDTPGVHRPRHKLGELMNQAAREALTDADVILFLADISVPPQDEDRLLADMIAATNGAAKTIFVLNKLDLLPPAKLELQTVAYQQLLPGAQILPLSAARGDHRDDLILAILARLPEGPEYFPREQITDLYERDIAADLIREAALLCLDDEVPHGIAVRIEDYKDRREEQAYIAATLFVERETHKGIVIGQGGAMLKKIGSAARQEIEALTGRHVFLDLKVKVQKGWRDDEQALRRLL